MNTKTHYKGHDHPMFKHGRYTGQKTTPRKPQAGVTKAIRNWSTTHVGTFEIDDVKASLPQFSSRQISCAIHGLHRRGELKALAHIGNQSKIWEVVK